MTKTIKVAVAGAGAFDIKHLDGIENIEGMKVISLVSRDLERTKEVDAVILCTPTQKHAAQTITCLQAGKHVQVEIALADSSKGAQDVVAQAKNSNLVAMCGHTRRFNIQQMDVQTFFFRRSNINALGKARCWANHLLWHHAAHTVDLFSYQCGSPIVKASAVQGPIHPRLGTFFRYFGDSATYIARYDDLFNDKEKV